MPPETLTPPAADLGRAFHWRYLIRRDLPAVLAIERASHLNPWDEAGFLAVLRRRTTAGAVLEWRGEVVAFAVYDRPPLARPDRGHGAGRVDLLALAVRPDLRGSGAGRYLLGRVVDRAECSRAPVVGGWVSEYDLAAQRFLKACGWTCVTARRGFFGPALGLRFEVRPAGLPAFTGEG